MREPTALSVCTRRGKEPQTRNPSPVARNQGAVMRAAYPFEGSTLHPVRTRRAVEMPLVRGGWGRIELLTFRVEGEE